MRKVVQRFAEAMENVLQKNDWKGGWEDCTFIYLHEKLTEEYKEIMEVFGLGQKIPHGTKSEKIDHIKVHQKEVRDLANICMMIDDNLEKRIDELQEKPVKTLPIDK